MNFNVGFLDFIIISLFLSIYLSIYLSILPLSKFGLSSIVDFLNTGARVTTTAEHTPCWPSWIYGSSKI